MDLALGNCLLSPDEELIYVLTTGVRADRISASLNMI